SPLWRRRVLVGVAHRGEAVRVLALRRDREAALVAGDRLDAPRRSRSGPHARALPRDVRGLQSAPAPPPRATGPSLHLEGQRPHQAGGDRAGRRRDARRPRVLTAAATRTSRRLASPGHACETAFG